MLRDNHAIYGWEFQRCVEALGIDDVRSAPRSPWQNPYVERVMGTIRRGYLDHIIPVTEQHMTRVLRKFLSYYNESRVHQSLDGNAPELREIDAIGNVHASQSSADCTTAPRGQRPDQSVMLRG